MKFDCGPTKEERDAALKARQQLERDKRRAWHPCFAWWPKRMGPNDCRWLEIIERREVKTGETYFPFGMFCPIPPTPRPHPVYGWEYRACQ